MWHKLGKNRRKKKEVMNWAKRHNKETVCKYNSGLAETGLNQAETLFDGARA